jgi:hypothetical protein
MHLYLQKLKTDKSLHLFKHLIDFNFNFNFNVKIETNIAFIIEILLDITEQYLKRTEDTEYHLFYLILLPILLEDIRKELKSMGKTDTIIEHIQTTLDFSDFLNTSLHLDKLIKEKRLKIYKLVFT